MTPGATSREVDALAYRLGLPGGEEIEGDDVARALFSALGWKGAGEIEVVRGRVPGADYKLQLGGSSRVFVGLTGDDDPSEAARALRRVGWSAKHPVALLIGRSRCMALDCRAPPDRESAPLFSSAHAQLGDQWDEVDRYFSRRALAGATLDRRGPAPKRGGDVDDALLEQLAGWRRRWGARPAQRVLEGMLFLRLAEARMGADDEGLAALIGSSDVSGALRAQLARAETRFGSQLFRLDPRRAPSPSDDEALRGIVAELCDPRSPFELAVLPVEVLGQAHEHAVSQAAHGRARKSGGVYYTPDYIVRHIVNSTLGTLLSISTPDDAAKLRVLDPSCGSGSFLVGALRLLIDWHRSWYVAHDAERHAGGESPALFRDDQGNWQLTSAKRRDIARSSIFGVDIDGEALEITKLSLLLETLDGRTPPAPLALDENITRGNSLIDTRFDYRRAFPEIFAEGGFDVVIGNPPYLSYGGRQLVDISKADRAYLAKHYECSGWATAHSFFIERSAKLLARRLVSFIVPDQVGHLDGYSSVRRVLLEQGGLLDVNYWGEGVFKGAVTPALTFILDKGARDASTRIVDAQGSEQRARFTGGAPWSVSGSADLLDKLRLRSTSIRALLADCGLRTTDAKRQVVPLGEATGEFLPTLEGKQVGRYWCAAPVVAVRLDSGQPVFRARDEKYARAKFIIRQTAAYPIVGPREHVTHFRNSLHALYEPEGGIDVRFLVGLLNSKLLRFAYVTTVRESQQRAFPQVKLGPLGMLPIRSLDLNRAAEKTRHDRIVDLVQSMLALQRARRHAEVGAEKSDSLRAQAQVLDAQIDGEVFELYELSSAEIARVEAAVASLAPPP